MQSTQQSLALCWPCVPKRTWNFALLLVTKINARKIAEEHSDLWANPPLGWEPRRRRWGTLTSTWSSLWLFNQQIAFIPLRFILYSQSRHWLVYFFAPHSEMGRQLESGTCPQFATKTQILGKTLTKFWGSQPVAETRRHSKMKEKIFLLKNCWSHLRNRSRLDLYTKKKKKKIRWWPPSTWTVEKARLPQNDKYNAWYPLERSSSPIHR